MRAVGLVAEYNPFHNGHSYHLQTAKQVSGAEAVVVVMSGNFTQRGEPALFDKWQRANQALAGGADLVVELPIFYAVQPGTHFAAGALRLLAALGVDEVVFGAEHPEWDFARLVTAEDDFQRQGFKDFRATYATQFNQALAEKTGVSLVDPNDILAFSYYKAARDLKLPLKLRPIQRRGADYHDQTISGEIASASAIRQAALAGEDVAAVVPPQTAADLANLRVVPGWAALYPLLRNHLIQAPVGYLAQSYLMSEGLEYRMKAAAERNLSFDGFLRAVKTKRYTYARLLRVCLYTLLELDQEAVERAMANPYLHVLAFNDRGRDYLHTVKKDLAYPLLTKVTADQKEGLVNADYRAGKLYQTFTPVEQDVKHAPVIKLSRKNH